MQNISSINEVFGMLYPKYCSLLIYDNYLGLCVPKNSLATDAIFRLSICNSCCELGNEESSAPVLSCTAGVKVLLIKQSGLSVKVACVIYDTFNIFIKYICSVRMIGFFNDTLK